MQPMTQALTQSSLTENSVNKEKSCNQVLNHQPKGDSLKAQKTNKSHSTNLSIINPKLTHSKLSKETKVMQTNIQP